MILGVPARPNSLLLNGSPVDEFEYDSTAQVLKIDSIDIKMDDKLNLSWSA